ncbi:MAG: hypothetical protein GX044_10495 [Firmicutes bacterium]|jgi:hypothetical protein|nr:hypothetical protein [Bacillota bacterium]
MKELLGLLLALGLISLGLLLLPAPSLDSFTGVFTALWLAVTLLAAVAFGSELRRRERLRRWRGKRRPAAGDAARRDAWGRYARAVEGGRQFNWRERRLD